MADASRRLLVLMAILFASWYLFELMRTPDAPASVKTDASPPSDLAVPKLTMDVPALTEFKATLDRPLFSESRRPADPEDEEVAETTPEETPKAAVPVRLSAVIIEEDEKSALLEETKSRTYKRVREGEAFEGWTLVEVRDDAVVLVSGGTRSEVELRNFETPPPVQPRRPQRRPGATRNKQKLRVGQKSSNRPGADEAEEEDDPFPPPMPPRNRAPRRDAAQQKSNVPRRNTIPLPTREADG